MAISVVLSDFSKLAKPLSDLLIGHGDKKTGKSGLKAQKVEWHWGMEQQNAFDLLIDRLVNAPILTYPDYQLPFILHIDASADGLGSVLYQKQNGIERVIAYASRGL